MPGDRQQQQGGSHEVDHSFRRSLSRLVLMRRRTYSHVSSTSIFRQSRGRCLIYKGRCVKSRGTSFDSDGLLWRRSTPGWLSFRLRDKDSMIPPASMRVIICVRCLKSRFIRQAHLKDNLCLFLPPFLPPARFSGLAFLSQRDLD